MQTAELFRTLFLPILDEAVEAASISDASWFGSLMLTPLDSARRKIAAEAWKNEIIPLCRNHLAYKFGQECPFSSHSTCKPRGYAGDALLVDFLYRSATIDSAIQASTPFGRSLCSFWAGSPAAAAVRNRRDLLAKAIMKAATTFDNFTVFSVACGHFRELARANIAENPKIKRVIGLDQDRMSLDHVRQNHPAGVELVHGSISAILRQKTKFSELSLVYASGLYDYLEHRIATRLTKLLFEMLHLGGRIIVPNFLSDAPNRASMELLQDWFLIYRDQEAITSLGVEIPQSQIESVSYHEDHLGSVGYLFITKK
jgi:hypothetical protein